MSQETRYITLGKSSYRRHELFLEEADLKRHLYLLGKTGVGKTTCLLNLTHQWMIQDGGLLLLDPHGDLFDDLIRRIPKRHQSKVVLIEPGDRAVGWNPLASVPSEQRPRAAQELVGALKAIYAESWGPRLEYILYNAVRLILDAETETLLGVQRVLTDRGYRSWLLESVEDPVVRSFWINEFNRWDPRFQKEAVSSIQNKIGQCLSDPALRAIIGQRQSTISPRELMDQGKIVLVNLSKGVLGEMSSSLLGALLVSAFTSAALSRQDIPEEERATFLMVIDEFQNFTSEAFSSLLSEARKYGLAIAASHQFGAQLKPSIRSAIIGNTGSHVLFRMGADDATHFHSEYGLSWEVSRFTGLKSFEAVTRLLHDGDQNSPEMMRTFPPPEISTDHSTSIRRLSNEKYTVPSKAVLEKQSRWMRREFS